MSYYHFYYYEPMMKVYSPNPYKMRLIYKVARKYLDLSEKYNYIRDFFHSLISTNINFFTSNIPLYTYKNHLSNIDLAIKALLIKLKSTRNIVDLKTS